MTGNQWRNGAICEFAKANERNAATFEIGLPSRIHSRDVVPQGVFLGCRRDSDGGSVRSLGWQVESARSEIPRSAHVCVDLRPFKDVERYIAFLERPDRAKWQRPDEVVKALVLSGNETVVDVGAGSGYFSFRFAKALPKGIVIATDIEPEMIRHIHQKAVTEHVANLRAELSTAGGPEIPAQTDIVFICDVLHHVADQPSFLSKLARAMKSGARLVLIEFKEGRLPQGPPEKLKISRSRLVTMAKDAGLTLDSEKPKLLPYQTFLVFRKP